MAGYEIKYRTFDSLFEDVTIDFRNYTLENLIEPQQLIKVAKRVTYDLGFRIYKKNHTVLEVENGRVRLPDDFIMLSYALVCGEYEIHEAYPQGTIIEERLLNAPKYVPYPHLPNPCEQEEPVCPQPCEKIELNQCGKEIELIQHINMRTIRYKYMFTLSIEKSKLVDCDCPNIHWDNSANKASIKDGFIYTNFNSGKIYISYLGDLVDDEGNLLVLDNEYANEYYEYALKERILENLLMNGNDVGNQYSLISEKLRRARNNAVSMVNTPNFKEMHKLWQTNRKAQYHKFYNMFKSYNPIGIKHY